VAQDNATVVEISRESFLRILLHQPDVALKIIAEISSRFRKTDDIVREYSSRIYREAHDNIEKELKSKFNSVEILYNAIEKTALTTVEHVERSWTTLTRFIRSVTVVTAVAVAVLGWFGIKEYSNIKVMRDEVSENLQIIEKEVSSIEKKVKEANELVDDIKTLKKSNNIIENITLKLGKIREDLALDKGRIEELSLESLNLGNQSYRRSKESLMKYVINYKNYDAEVVLEAISITLELFKQKKMVLYREDILQIHDVLIAFAISSGHNWRVRRSIRANAIVLKNLTGDIGFQTLKDWKRIAADKNVDEEVRENASRILVSLGYEGKDIKQLFTENIEEDGESFWKSHNAAIALINMEDKKGLDYIVEQSKRHNRRGLWAAIFLSYVKKDKIETMIGKYKEFDQDLPSSIADEITKTLHYMKENHDQSLNPFLEAYALKIAACLGNLSQDCP
jgi:uncharacterized protein YoxC